MHGAVPEWKFYFLGKFSIYATSHTANLLQYTRHKIPASHTLLSPANLAAPDIKINIRKSLPREPALTQSQPRKNAARICFVFIRCGSFTIAPLCGFKSHRIRSYFLLPTPSTDKAARVKPVTGKARRDRSPSADELPRIIFCGFEHSLSFCRSTAFTKPPILKKDHFSFKAVLA